MDRGVARLRPFGLEEVLPFAEREHVIVVRVVERDGAVERPRMVRGRDAISGQRARLRPQHDVVDMGHALRRIHHDNAEPLDLIALTQNALVVGNEDVPLIEDVTGQVVNIVDPVGERRGTRLEARREDVFDFLVEAL